MALEQIKRDETQRKGSGAHTRRPFRADTPHQPPSAGLRVDSPASPFERDAENLAWGRPYTLSPPTSMVGSVGHPVAPDLDARIHAERQLSGRPIAPEWRSSMERRLGQPLAEVRVRQGSEAENSSRHPWAWLLSRVFAVDIMTCPRCRGAMRLVKIANRPDEIARALADLGLGPRPPPRPRPAPAGQLELEFDFAA